MRARVLASGAVLLAAIVATGCATDIATPVDPPMIDIALAPAKDAAFPEITSARLAATRDTLEFDVRRLPPDPIGHTYQIALIDTVSLHGVSVISRVIRRTPKGGASATTDTLVGAQFSVTDTSTTVNVRLVGALLANYTHLVLRSSGEGSVPVTLAATARTGFLAVRYRAGATNTLQIDPFGAWSPASTQRLRFDGAGSVTSAGLWGDWIRLDFANLTRPPAGFRYSAWLVNGANGAAVRIGGLIAPAPSERSLDDADLGDCAWFTASTVVASRVRANLAALGVQRSAYPTLVLALEAYGGFGVATAPGSARIFGARLP